MRLTVEDAAESLTQPGPRQAKCFGSYLDEIRRGDLIIWDGVTSDAKVQRSVLGRLSESRRPHEGSETRYYTGAIYNKLREMAEELATLKEEYRRQWLAENRPYWLESVLARYDQMISIWLTRSRAMDEALRKYEMTSTLPEPESFGLGTRLVVPQPNRQ